MASSAQTAASHPISQSDVVTMNNSNNNNTGQQNTHDSNKSSGYANHYQDIGQQDIHGNISKDAQVIAAILKEMSVEEYEPRVVHQLMEFTHRYVTSVLQEAQVFSSYAKKKTIDVDDIQLAVNMQIDKTVTSPPPKDLLMEIAREKNNQPLPPIKTHNGPRLPFDRYSLIGTNYKLKSPPR